MINGIVRKVGSKWVLIAEGEVIFKANTRVKCFKYAHEHEIRITGYEHGKHEGNN